MTASPKTTLRVDLHNHTSGSFDCLSDPEALLGRALERGLDRIAITDHNRLGVALEMFERYPDRIIPGEEVKTGEGFDLIGLYLTKEIRKGTLAREACDLIRADGGLVYLPHPFAPGKGGGGKHAESLAAHVDIIEVFNARLHPGRLNEPALALAESHGKLKGAGSDAHSLREVGGAWVELPVHENSPQELRGALGEGRVTGSTAPLWIHLASTWAKVRKVIPG